jgi:DNA polymerase-3 subunit alpha
MQWDMGKDTKIWGENITQWPYEQCEALGLIKMDFLSLSDLDVVKNTIENIKHTTGEDINEMEILDGGLDDKETYQLLASGGTVGVFQMSSDGYKDLMVRMKPDNFEDISAALALYRPGPMGMNAHYDYADGKNNRIKVEVFDPAFAGSPLEKILKPTFQKIVYQEQVMQISSQMAGFTLGQADSLRKAMGHKKPEVMAQMKSKFVDGCLEHGYPKKPVEKLWGYIEKFSAYAFNKAHSAAYGLTSYETAYFKTHYPAEFMAAYMTDKIGSKDKLPLLIKECSKMGLKISGISINKSYGAITSARKNSADDPDIVFGFNAINGMSPTTSNKLVKARDENGGSFKDLDDVMKALPKELISKSIIENLAMVGAFDEFGLARRAVFVSAEDLVKFYKDIAANKAKGQASLFDMFAPNAGTSKFRVPDIDDWSFTERLSKEKALMGIYVSSTPMHNLGPGLSYLKASYTGTPITPIEDIIGRANRGNFRTIAVFTEAEQRTNKKGQPFFNCTIEDETGSLSAKIFGNNAENILQSSGQPNVDSVYVITGSYFNGFGDRKTYSIEDISEVELTPDGKIPLWIRLTKAEYTNKGFDKVKDALRKCPGHLPVFFSIKNTDGTVTDDIFDADIDDSQESMIKIESIVGSKRLGKWN